MTLIMDKRVASKECFKPEEILGEIQLIHLGFCSLSTLVQFCFLPPGNWELLRAWGSHLMGVINVPLQNAQLALLCNIATCTTSSKTPPSPSSAAASPESLLPPTDRRKLLFWGNMLKTAEFFAKLKSK